MDDLGFLRTPDRPVKSLETRVRYQRSVETSIGACGPDFLGGSTTREPRLRGHQELHIIVGARTRHPRPSAAIALDSRACGFSVRSA